jgi:hypothetical protein
MSGLFIVFVAWVCNKEIKEWFSSAIAEGIRRSKES